MDPTTQPTAAVAESIDAQLLELMLRLGSRWVLWLLIGLSLLAVAQMIERVWFYLRERSPRAALDTALAALRSQDPRDPASVGTKAALDALAHSRSMEAAVARVAMGHASEGAASVREHVAAAVERERLRYERGLAILGTLGSNAPFIGLFGTVLGIIRAFADLSANTAQGASAVMAGIAEALIATAVGLLVALPAVVAFNACTRHVERCVAGAEALGHEVLAWIEAQRPSGPATDAADATKTAQEG
jgi:biopolymer transport protein ExbB/TolQ